MAISDLEDPTELILHSKSVVSTDPDSEKFALLVLSYYNAQIHLQGAQAEFDDLTRRIRTPTGITKRHFTVAEALEAKEADAKLVRAKLELKQAEVEYNATTIALDQWIPDSLKPFLKVSGCITAPSSGDYPFIGVTMPKEKYMVIQARSEADIINEARRQKETARHDFEY